MRISFSMTSKIVTLTTDFGLKDSYVAEIKAVILRIFQKAIIVDITHEIAKFNTQVGAYVLACSAPYFPKGSVHLAVVDPGVGTKRRPIVIQTQKGYFVGPDNGILFLAAEKQGIIRIHELSNPELMEPKVSNTFHGRDIFAPAAAHLARGINPEEFGPKIIDVEKPEFSIITRKEGRLIGMVLHVDGFGNIVTNITDKEMEQIHAKGKVSVELPNYKVKMKLCKAYGEAKHFEPLALVGSHNFLEIAINQGNASKKFKVNPGDKIKLLLKSSG